MGISLSSSCADKDGFNIDERAAKTDNLIGFHHFEVLRTIGKGSFGKVCIAQKKSNKKLYAMKYMSKETCLRNNAVKNVLREVQLLQVLEHPFLVNLRYTFQDDEELFILFDLYMGGDLRYHLQQHNVRFNVNACKFYLSEIALALDYLSSKWVIHRDLKPDNILLCEKGHAHLTDFNVATIITPPSLANTVCGTKPYIAPEVFQTALGTVGGYDFAVDWWSLGVTLYELWTRERPFDIPVTGDVETCLQVLNEHTPKYLDRQEPLMHVIHLLLQNDRSQRLCTLQVLKSTSLMSDVKWDSVNARGVSPIFVPSNKSLNCDATFELEEVMMGTQSIHKKTHKPNKVKMPEKPDEELSEHSMQLRKLEKEFPYYARD